MKLCEKLDFLMKVTDTSNRVLGNYLSFDASYISRIRSGKRNAPKSAEFAESSAGFFARHIEDDYQKKILCEFLCPGKAWPDDPKAAKALLYRWLSCPEEEAHGPAEPPLPDFSAARCGEPSPVGSVSPAPRAQDPRFFYGNSGKREAVSLFLSELIELETPPPLLLYSNEEFSWLYEDPAFARQWASLLFRYIEKGGRIKIAHTISRASGEMFVALQKWIPIYKTGAVEPYFYPKILDRVFRKTLFIAQGHSAIAAGSVGEHTENAVNCYIHDRQAVQALEEEYRHFLELCRPLMQIFNFAKKDLFSAALQSFDAGTENTMTVRSTPSFYTMPKSVADSMTKRLDSSWLLNRREKAAESFRQITAEGRSLTELLNLPDPEKIRQGRVHFPVCDLLDKPGLFYTPAEFRAHLESVIRHLRDYDNYHVVLSSALPEDEIVYVKEDMGVILVKAEVPSIAFAISEQRMVSAFWDYLNEMKGATREKEQVIRQLEDFVQKL